MGCSAVSSRADWRIQNGMTMGGCVGRTRIVIGLRADVDGSVLLAPIFTSVVAGATGVGEPSAALADGVFRN